MNVDHAESPADAAAPAARRGAGLTPVRVGLLLIVAAVVGLTAYRYAALYPKRFGVVTEGQLLRCGDITPEQLKRVKAEFGVRTVLSMLNPDVPESAAERAAAAEIGLRWENVPLRGNGASTPEDRDRIRAILRDPAARPLLVHCSAGVNRTGLAVGMYRLHVERWTLNEVLEELHSTDFENLEKHQNLLDALAAEAALAGVAGGP